MRKVIKKKSTDILIITTGQGHESLAHVMADEIRNQTDFTVEIFKYFPKVEIHLFLHRYAPWLMRLLAKPLANKNMTQLSRTLTAYKFKAMVGKQIKKHRPKVVISSFYLLNPAIEELKTKYGFYFINLLTDPKTMILLNPSPGADVNFTFDKLQSEQIHTMYESIKTKEVGWFVKSTFEQDYDQHQAKKELSLDPNLPLFLMTSGSLGNASPAQLLPGLLSIKKPMQMILICGSNELLKNMAENFKKTFLKDKPVDFRVVGFTKKMDKYMRAADLIIGKSGPNTLFEAAATLTPFMSIDYGGEQEKGNQELIIGYNLGWIETNHDKIWLKLKEFIENPSMLNVFKADLEKMKLHNMKSKKILIEEITKVVKNN